MPIYHRLGKLPPKRHQVFRKDDGSIYFEQLFGNKGFVGPSSLLYHLHPPTEVKEIRHLRDVTPVAIDDRTLKHRHFRTSGLPVGGSCVLDRVPLFFNDDAIMSAARPDRDDDFFYRNGQGDELVYVTEGAGVLQTQFGPVPFADGDYLVIPRGTVHRWTFSAKPARMILFESVGYVRTPRHYRNEHGQLVEGAPFNERDIRPPGSLEVHDEKGDFEIVVKQHHQLSEYTLGHHPFDVVGWDGYYYPWALSIHAFEPKVARFHLPPPVHQTFEAEGFVICSFCPRPYDFDPESVPAPYFHANAMSDEVLYYATSEFMSRKGIEFGSVTLHPDGIPHGPQPGKMEASIGQKHTDELAVMFDTFRPLKISRQTLEIEDGDYWRSWLT